MSDLTNQYIDESFQKLLQVDGTTVQDGTGSMVTQLDLSVSSANTATSASYATTASFALNVTDPTWDNITNKPAGLVSGSSQVVIGDTTGNLLGARILGPVTDAVNSVSSSYSVTATSASFANTATNASSASIADTANTAIIAISASHALVADTAGTATSVEWNGVLNKPSGLVSGSSQIDLSQATGVATNALTASKVSDTNIAYQNQNNTFIGTQTFDNIAVNGTGSFAYIQSVTGSAKIIGDAYIILNNATPAERYAGIVVQDSGSGSPLTTASLEFDGQSNDWFYEYSDDGGVTTDHGVALFGPEYPTKGTPTYPTNNRIQKGNGGHHLLDSSITDNGIIISTPLGISAGNTVLSTVGGTYASIDGGQGGFFEVVDTSGNNLGFGLNPSVYGTSGWTGPGIWGNDPADNYPVLIGFQDKSSWTDGRVTFLTPVSASSGIIGNLTGNATTATTASFALTSADSGNWNGQYNGDAGITGSLVVNNRFTANYGTIAEGTETDISSWNPVQDQNGNTFNLAHNLLTNYPAFGAGYRGAWGIEYYDSYSYNFGNEFYVSPTRTQYVMTSPSGNTAQDLFRWVENSGDANYNKTQKYITADRIQFESKDNTYGATTFQYNNSAGTGSNLTLGVNGGDATKSQIDLNANSINLGGYDVLSGDGFISIGNETHTNTVQIAAQDITTEGRVTQVTQFPSITGTYTVDLSVGNAWQIGTTGDTVITVSGAVAGRQQTINLVINNQGGHAITFSGVQWPGGTAPTISTGTDVVTLITNGTNVLGTAVQNFS